MNFNLQKLLYLTAMIRSLTVNNLYKSLTLTSAENNIIYVLNITKEYMRVCGYKLRRQKLVTC